MKFTIDQLEELDVYPDQVEITHRIDSGRWTEYFALIFKHEDKFYVVNYQQGLTEMQWESYAERFTDAVNGEVECPEVLVYTELVEKKTWRQL